MKKNYTSITQLRHTPACGGIARSKLKKFLWTKKLLKNMVAT
jgi:hypothetical protein